MSHHRSCGGVNSRSSSRSKSGLQLFELNLGSTPFLAPVPLMSYLRSCDGSGGRSTLDSHLDPNLPINLWIQNRCWLFSGLSRTEHFQEINYFWPAFRVQSGSSPIYVSPELMVGESTPYPDLDWYLGCNFFYLNFRVLSASSSIPIYVSP